MHVATRRTSAFSAGRAAARRRNPIASILSCADSRVAPGLRSTRRRRSFRRARGGQHRPTDLLSLEYGAQFLGSPLIVVLGPPTERSTPPSRWCRPRPCSRSFARAHAGLKPAVIGAEGEAATCSTTRSPRTFGGNRRLKARRRSSKATYQKIDIVGGL
jgi:hypothetical protein